MRIQNYRVSLFDTFESRFSVFGHQEKPSVGSVDMKPHIVLPGDPANLLERIYSTQIGGPCIPDHQEWAQSRFLIPKDPVFQVSRVHAVIFIEVDIMDRAFFHAAYLYSLLVAVMGVPGGIDYSLLQVPSLDLMSGPCGRNRDQVGEATT